MTGNGFGDARVPHAIGTGWWHAMKRMAYLGRVPLIGAGALIAASILAEPVMQEALRHMLLDSWQQVLALAAAFTFLAAAIHYTTQAAVLAIAPALYAAPGPAGIVARHFAWVWILALAAAFTIWSLMIAREAVQTENTMGAVLAVLFSALLFVLAARFYVGRAERISLAAQARDLAAGDGPRPLPPGLSITVVLWMVFLSIVTFIQPWALHALAGLLEPETSLIATWFKGGILAGGAWAIATLVVAALLAVILLMLSAIVGEAINLVLFPQALMGQGWTARFLRIFPALPAAYLAVLINVGLFGTNPTALTTFALMCFVGAHLPLGLLRPRRWLDSAAPMAGLAPYHWSWVLAEPVLRLGRLNAHQHLVLTLILGAALLIIVLFVSNLWGAGTAGKTLRLIAENAGALSIALLWGATGMAMFFLPILISSFHRFGGLTVIFLYAVLLSYLGATDNHWVRGLRYDALFSTAPVGARMQSERKAADREWQPAAWLNERPNRDRYQRYPIFLVATEGGGLRAAYFTASVLGAIQDICPSFAGHVLAISSVSGGSLGAAAFAAKSALHEGTQTRGKPCNFAYAKQIGAGATATPAGFQAMAQQVFAGDYLAPALAGFFFPDAFQRIWSIPFQAWDRSRYLELAFEQAWSNHCAAAPCALTMGAPLLAFHKIPLFLTATEIESGNQIAVATHRLPPGASHLTLNQKVEDMSRLALSTAALLSARFPYLMSAGKVQLTDGTARRYLDGGVFESSGAWFARRLLEIAARELATGPARRGPDQDQARQDLDGLGGRVASDPFAMAPILNVIVVRSTPDDTESSCDDDPAARAPAPQSGPADAQSRPAQPLRQPCDTSSAFHEIASPILGTLNARLARGRISVQELEAFATFLNARTGVEIVRVHRIDLKDEDPSQRAAGQTTDRDIPISWILSDRARRLMDSRIARIVRSAWGPPPPTGDEQASAARAETVSAMRDILCALQEQIGYVPGAEEPCSAAQMVLTPAPEVWIIPGSENAFPNQPVPAEPRPRPRRPRAAAPPCPAGPCAQPPVFQCPAVPLCPDCCQ